jgi:redox-sensitive bicupin YhaK (pirin superfamily)
MVISTSRLDIEDIAFLIVHVSGCGHASGTLEQETYELLLVWVAPPEALKKPQPTLAATALADSSLNVSLESLERDALQATCG